jgi:hypothetical protein
MAQVLNRRFARRNVQRAATVMALPPGGPKTGRVEKRAEWDEGPCGQIGRTQAAYLAWFWTMVIIKLVPERRFRKLRF